MSEIEGIFTKGLKSSLSNTELSDGKLRVAIDTGEMYLDDDNSGLRIPLAVDIVKGNTEEEILSILAPLPLFYYSTDTHKLFYYDNEWITVGGDSSHATNADTATYAVSANYANSAGSANSVAWSSVTNKPTSLDHATNADTATYAKRSGISDGVDWVNVTNKPTSLDHATNADTATYANSAGSANSVAWNNVTNKPTNFGDTVSKVETGSTNGTVKVTTNGSTAEVAVKGLGSAAYTASSAYAAASHNHTTANITNFTSAVQGTKVSNATNADTATYANSAGSATNDDDGDSIKSTYGNRLSLNGSSLSLKNKNNTEISSVNLPQFVYEAGDGLDLEDNTFINTGVRNVTLDGNNLNINTNGTTANITIPYSTNADTATYANSAGSVAWNNVTNKPTNFGDTVSKVETGSTNGTVKVTTNGSTAEVAVKGLGSAAYTASSAYAAVSHGNHLPSTNGTTSQYLRGDNTWQTLDNSHNHTTANITNFTSAVQGTKVSNATNADTATYATKALNDKNGKDISATYAPLVSPNLDGTPTTPTPATGDKSTTIANTSFVMDAIDSAVGEITSIKYEVVNSLPSTGVNGVIYLVPKSSSQVSNVYDEYIWVSNGYEKIGDTEIDLSQYINNAEVTGSGNAITAITKSGNKITFTKGSTFLTDHPVILINNNTTSTGSPDFGGTFTAIDNVTKDSNGHVTSVNTKTVEIPSYTASTTKAGLVPAHSNNTGQYLRGDNTWQTLDNSHNHTTANITNFTSAVQGTKVSNATNADTATYANSAGSVAWNNVTNKPTNFGDTVSKVETGGTNGTIKVTTNGSTAEVAVKGLGSAAYTASSAYAAASHNHTTANITNFTSAVQGIKVSNAGTSDYANSAGSVAWNNVTNKPTNFGDTVSKVETGGTNGTIKVTTNGSTAEVAVKGLGSAAYTASSAYAAASHNHTTANITNFTNAVQDTKVSNATNADTAAYATSAGSANSVTWSNVTNKPTNFGDTVSKVETGGTNGTIKVTTNGSTAEVAVKGLGSAAYTASSAYAAASHNHTTANITNFTSAVQGTKVNNAGTSDYATSAGSATTAYRIPVNPSTTPTAAGSIWITT